MFGPAEYRRVTFDQARRSPLAAPIATGVGLVAAATFVAVVDPHSSAVTPPCPFRLVTGWWCPACGMTRSVHHLMHGEVVPSLSDNLFTVVVVAAIAVSWWTWLERCRGGDHRDARRFPPAGYLTIAAVALAYTVVRNLPSMVWLRGAA